MVVNSWGAYPVPERVCWPWLPGQGAHRGRSPGGVCREFSSFSDPAAAPCEVHSAPVCCPRALDHGTRGTPRHQPCPNTPGIMIISVANILRDHPECSGASLGGLGALGGVDHYICKDSLILSFLKKTRLYEDGSAQIRPYPYSLGYLHGTPVPTPYRRPYAPWGCLGHQ